MNLKNKQNIVLVIGAILATIISMSFTSYGSFDPKTIGFYLSLSTGVFLYVFFKMIVKFPKNN